MRTAALCLAMSALLAAAETFEALAAKADAARDAGRTDEAVDLYQQALHLKPDWREGWWSLGSVLYDANRYQDCAEAFLPLTKLDADKSPGWAMAGLCEFETRNYKDALRHLELGEKLGLPASLYDVAEYHIALILIRGGQFDAAIERISRYASVGKENPKLVEAMGAAGLRRPVLPEALTPGERELAMALGRAMCDAAASRGKEAAAEFEAILAKYPHAAEVHYLYGMVLTGSDPDKALAAFGEELARSPRHVPALISTAAEYVRRGDYRTAVSFAERAVAADGSSFATHAMLGKALVEGGLDMARGTKELEKAVELAPGNPQSRLALAAAYAKEGRKEDAAQQRREFLRLRTQIDANAAGQK